MNNFYIRLIFSSFVGLFIIAGLSNAIYPQLIRNWQDSIAQELSVDESQHFFSTKKLDSSPILESINNHNLAWYYLTNGKGQLVGRTKEFAPEINIFEEKSRRFSWQGGFYYESVVPVKKNLNLHIGFYDSQPFGFTSHFLTDQIPIPIFILVLLAYALMIALLYYLSVAWPVRQLQKYFQRKENTSAAAGNLNLLGAVNDILAVRKLIERKEKVLEEKESLLAERDARIRKLKGRYEEDINSANKEKNALYRKEAENKFIDTIAHHLDECTRITDIGNTILSSLLEEFPQSFELGLFFLINKKQESVLTTHIGFINSPALVYKDLGNLRGLPYREDAESCLTTEVQDLSDPRLREIAERNACRKVIFLPLRFQNRHLAYLTLFFRGQANSLEPIKRILNRASWVVGKALYHIIVYEELTEAARTDTLTGYPNKNYLAHLMPQLTSFSDTNSGIVPFSLLLLEGHDLNGINEKLGRLTGDLLVKELARRIEVLLQQRRAESIDSRGDYLIRYGGAQFLIILRGADAKKTTIFAQRLKQVVEGTDWPCGLGKWSTAIGITSFPEDTTDPQDLIINMEIALSYARGQADKEKIVSINHVPKAFRSAKMSCNLGGSLDIFDAAALLQSLSISRKSGILSVSNSDGKVFWCYLENGKPTLARMGKFGGSTAIVEFLVIFDSGDFNFTDVSGIDKRTLDEIRQLDKHFAAGNSLERDLMDGALARDHYMSAQNLIEQTDLFVWPHLRQKGESAFLSMQAMKDPPSPSEEQSMREILQLANGKTSLKTIFEQLETTPTHSLWRGAALLIQHDLIHLKKLATGSIQRGF